MDTFSCPLYELLFLARIPLILIVVYSDDNCCKCCIKEIRTRKNIKNRKTQIKINLISMK